MPPEALEGENSTASPAQDIWALGIMLYIMLFAKYPFNGIDPYERKKSILNDKLMFPKKVALTTEVKGLITDMLAKDPSKRMEMIDIL